MLTPALTVVNGNIDFGMIPSVLIGNAIFGNDKFTSAPISEILKKRSSLSAASFEEPILPRPPISNVSAPPKTFLIKSEPPKPIPKS